MKKKKQTTFSVAEAAKYLHVSKQAIHDAVRSKRIKSRRIVKVMIKKMKVTILNKSDLDKFAATISRSHQQRGFLKNR